MTGKEARATNEDVAQGAADLRETLADLDVQGVRLDAQRAPLAAILSSLRDGVLAGGPGRRATILSNEAYERIAASGHPELEDDEGRPVATAEGLRARAARGKSFTGQFRTIRSDGTPRWYEVVGQPVDIGGDRFGGVVVIRDMTDRSLRRLQNEFVAIVAHELRTPLTALRGYLELSDRALSDRQSGDEQQLVRLALEQASRLQSLIGELFNSAAQRHRQAVVSIRRRRSERAGAFRCRGGEDTERTSSGGDHRPRRRTCRSGPTPVGSGRCS